MSFKILGVKFYISVPFSVLMAFLLVTDKTGLMGMSLVAVAVHELGHLVAMKIMKSAPNSVEFGIGGVLIRNNAYASFKDGIIVAVTGPMANFLLSALLYLFGRLFKVDYLLVSAAVQFVVGGMNLLPVKGLDGGTVMSTVLEKVLKRNAGLVASLISIVTACAMTVAGLAVLVKNVSNPSLLLLGIYLIIINISRLYFDAD